MREVKSRGIEIREPWLDKVVAYFDPKRAVARRHARAIMALTGSYTGARKDRRPTQSWKASSGSADSDINYDNPTLRNRSRDLVKNNTVGCGAVNTVVTKVVGSGLKLNARIDHEITGQSEDEAREMERRVERGWRLWSKRCDITRTQSFAGLQALIIQSTLESGDCFVLLPFKRFPGDAFGLKLQVIEADRVCNPNNGRDSTTLSDGVELDSYGGPIAYHIMSHHPGDFGKGFKRAWKRYAAWTPDGTPRVLHIFRRKRPGQHRGVPLLTPVIEAIKQLGDYSDAEISAAVVSSFFTVMIKSDSGEGLAPMDPTAETGGSTLDEDYKLAPGAILEAAPGDDITQINPSRPNSNFDPFWVACVRQIGMALEIPYEVLVKHFTSSYSASRAAMMEAWSFFRVMRSWMVEVLCSPLYELWMIEAIARGYINAPGFETDPIKRAAYLEAEWIGPAPVQIDPLKEVKAARERIDGCLSTHSEECMALTGTDFDSKTARMKREREIVQSMGGGGQAPADKNDDQNDDQNDDDPDKGDDDERT